MNDSYWKSLECDECCYTCKNNRNAMTKDFPVNCEFENHKDVTAQDIWCSDYELQED